MEQEKKRNGERNGVKSRESNGCLDGIDNQSA